MVILYKGPVADKEIVAEGITLFSSFLLGDVFYCQGVYTKYLFKKTKVVSHKQKVAFFRTYLANSMELGRRRTSEIQPVVLLIQ